MKINHSLQRQFKIKKKFLKKKVKAILREYTILFLLLHNRMSRVK